MPHDVTQIEAALIEDVITQIEPICRLDTTAQPQQLKESSTFFPKRLFEQKTRTAQVVTKLNPGRPIVFKTQHSQHEIDSYHR